MTCKGNLWRYAGVGNIAMQPALLAGKSKLTDNKQTSKQRRSLHIAYLAVADRLVKADPALD